MINLGAAFLGTLIVWVVTLLQTGISLPPFMFYLLWCVSYLVIKEIKYERGE